MAVRWNRGGVDQVLSYSVARARSDIPPGHPQTNHFATNKLVLFHILPVREAVLPSRVFIGPQINLLLWTSSKLSERTSGEMR